MHCDTEANWKQNRNEDEGGNRRRGHLQRQVENLLEYLHRDWHEDDSQHTCSDEQANRVRLSASCFHQFCRQYRRDRGDSQRDQRDLHRRLKIKNQYEGDCEQRHENVNGEERANQLTGSAKQVSRVLHTGLESDREDS